MRAGIALGTNLGDRLRNLRDARARVLAIPGIGQPVKISGIYETEPVGCEPGTAAFLNAVIEVEWDGGPPQTLLAALREIEREMGRPSRYPRNAPRLIDLDLLYVEGAVASNGELTLPHPRMAERRFVLAPLAEICPELILPGQNGTVADQLARLPEEPRVILLSPSFSTSPPGAENESDS